MVSLPSILGGSGNKGEEFDVEAVLATLSLAEKISLLGGKVRRLITASWGGSEIKGLIWFGFVFGLGGVGFLAYG